jgi:kumamolisin
MSTTSAQPHGRILPAPVARAGERPGFDMRAIASYYAFPARFDGTGTTIAILSLYGGFRRSDLDAYFSSVGLGTPAIDVIPVGGAANNPVADPRANVELVMSLEMLGSIAPGARLAVYIAPNTEQGVVDGLSKAIFDQEHHADILCLTWAADEAGASGMLARMIDDSMKTALVRGLPVCAPAGLWADGKLRPTYPGSHPLVLACGATRAVRQGSGLTEQPMMATASQPAGSVLWPMDRWQAKGIKRAVRRAVRGRLVPDVSALADPEIGYRCYVNGQWVSVSDPGIASCLWAGLLARLHQARGRPWGMVGSLYSTLGPAGTLTAVPAAKAGSRPAPAWDSRVGWGSPDGERMLAKLTAVSRR